MAGMMIGGLRVKSVDLIREQETGAVKITGKYELIGTNDKVIAKQGFNGYQDIELGQSPKTKQLMDDLMASVKDDMSATLGMGS